MRGRDLFNRYRGLLNFFTKLLGLLPRGLRAYLWVLSDGLPDKMGLALRYCLLKRLAKRCGDNVFIGRSVEIKHWDKLSIGSNVSIHKQCYLDACGGIDIADDVSIAHQSSLISFEHTWDDASLPIRDNPVRLGRIAIADDVWIGCGCRILAGVTVHSGSIVAAGAVVTKNVPRHTVAAGVPAKPIKTISRGLEYEYFVGT